MKVKPILFVLIFAAVSPVFSDTVIFRDGTVIQGRLKQQTVNSIVIISDGKEQVFQKKIVRRVSYGETEEEKKQFEELKRKSEQLKSSTMSVDVKSRQLAFLQNEIEKLFKQQEERRNVAEKLDEEFQVLLKKEISGPNALLRQAAFPGWGHWYRGENIKAVSWASGFSAVLIGAYSLNGAASKSKSSYKNSIMTSNLAVSQITTGTTMYNAALLHMALVEGKYSVYEKNAKRFNQSITIISTVYLASLLHLAWDNWLKARFVKENESDEGQNSSLNRTHIDFFIAENPSTSQNKRERDLGFIVKVRF